VGLLVFPRSLITSLQAIRLFFREYDSDTN
jgi:hypothetical protein